MKIQSHSPAQPLFPIPKDGFQPSTQAVGKPTESAAFEMRLRDVATQNAAASNSTPMDAAKAGALAKTASHQISTSGAAATRGPSFEDVLRLLQD